MATAAQDPPPVYLRLVWVVAAAAPLSCPQPKTLGPREARAAAAQQPRTLRLSCLPPARLQRLEAVRAVQAAAVVAARDLLGQVVAAAEAVAQEAARVVAVEVVAPGAEAVAAALRVAVMEAPEPATAALEAAAAVEAARPEVPPPQVALGRRRLLRLRW